MRIKITTILFLIPILCFSQKDSTRKDTVRVPLYEVTDTMKRHIIYADQASNVKYCYGFIIVRGYKQGRDMKLKWAETPTIIGVLDEKKKALTAKWIEIKN